MYWRIKDDIVIYNQEKKSSKNKEENKIIRNIGIEEGGRILTDGNRTIKFERVDRGYEMYELSGNRYTRCGIVNADEETENEDLWAMATDELY